VRDAAVPIATRSGTGRWETRRRRLQGEGSLMKFDEGMVRRTELVMVVAVIILVLVAYVISKI
jgi:hypothetical protein